MIKFIGDTSLTTYKSEDFNDFHNWAIGLEWYELDIETNVVEQLPQRELKTIQFGHVDVQWVLQWDTLSEEEQGYVKTILENKKVKKYIHHALFEYTVLGKYGIIIDNVVCTLLQEKILYTGLTTEPGFYSLKRLLLSYLNVDISKEEQTSFDVKAYTDRQIEYAATDVKYLKQINDIQYEKLEFSDLLKVRDLENQAVCAFGDIIINGMLLDQDAWRANYDWAVKLVDEDKAILDSWIRGPLASQATKLGILKDKDEITINWKSPKQRKEIFLYLYPDLEGVTKPFIKKYADAHQDECLWEYLEGNFEPLNTLMMRDHTEFLTEGGYMLPKGSVTINWNSTTQRLEFFKLVEPDLESTSKEALAMTTHPIIQDYINYIDTVKLVTSYGESYIEKYVDDDGYVRTNFNQILNTGRVSSSNPNMQQIPAKESVGNRYRSCFVAPEDWVYVSSDFNSQELVVIATISEDPVWMEALRKGEDLHSICADLVFGKKWKDAAEDDCRYYVDKQKCNCKKHKTMRTAVKTVNFGLAYGMSANKLSATIRISKHEAEALIKKYFSVFPKIGATLAKLAGFGMVNGYIITPQPFLRRRWFDKGPTDKEKVIEHLNGSYNKELGIIERASKNTPIQGGSGDMTKLALVYIRNYINDNNLRDTIKLSMQVHDQIDTICHKDYADVWQKEMTTLMEAAAKVVIPSGLLTSETNISLKWEK